MSRAPPPNGADSPGVAATDEKPLRAVAVAEDAPAEA